MTGNTSKVHEAISLMRRVGPIFDWFHNLTSLCAHRVVAVRHTPWQLSFSNTVRVFRMWECKGRPAFNVLVGVVFSGLPSIMNGKAWVCGGCSGGGGDEHVGSFQYGCKPLA